MNSFLYPASMGQTLSDKGRDITAVKYSEIVVIPSIGPYGHSNPSNILRIILNLHEGPPCCLEQQRALSDTRSSLLASLSRSLGGDSPGSMLPLAWMEVIPLIRILMKNSN